MGRLAKPLVSVGGLVATALLLAGCASSGGAADAAGGAGQAGGAASPGSGAAATDSGGAAGGGAAAIGGAQATGGAQAAGIVAEEAPTLARIFTAGQAQRGRAAFDETCSECHTTSEFRGRSFQNNWGRRTVYALFRTIRSTMPDDNPGGLEESVYLDVSAYILDLNGHAAGDAELTAESPMREVRLAPPEGS